MTKKGFENVRFCKKKDLCFVSLKENKEKSKENRELLKKKNQNW